MNNIVWPSRLYEFLSFIQKSDLEKIILDCGAGGSRPPLALFHEWGYECHGIDISQTAIDSAISFASEHGLSLNLKLGDMRDLAYEDETFSFVYTQNSICHLKKEDQKKAIDEMLHVLTPEGILYADFMSTESSYCGLADLGKDIGQNEYHYVDEDGEDVLHVFFDDDEADTFFENAEIIHKLKMTRALKIPRNSVDVWHFYYAKK
ncbi:MAG: class I SAM-dependent methyltransferase [Candidatus Thorarchaeota archaeon]|nr:class I SAM-dependent methyltransferase [Candidatus Thorarchaeota archaeon]